jgi:hypothetical protein
MASLPSPHRAATSLKRGIRVICPLARSSPPSWDRSLGLTLVTNTTAELPRGDGLALIPFLLFVRRFSLTTPACPVEPVSSAFLS